MIYIVPVGNFSAEAATILARSEVAVLSDGNLLQKLAGTLAKATSIVQLTEDELQVVVRNATHLLSDTPVTLTAVPGLRYPAQWMMIAARLHPVDWLTLEATLTKAGFMANSVSDIEKRAGRDDVVGKAQKETLAFFTDDEDDEETAQSKPFDDPLLDGDLD